MTEFIFKGPETNLGRFGMVKTGDRIMLTDLEARSIANDTRFRHALAYKETTPAPPQPDHIAKASDPETVGELEVRGKSYEELVKIAEKINAGAGITLIDFNERTSRARLLSMILDTRSGLHS